MLDPLTFSAEFEKSTILVFAATLVWKGSVG